MTYISIDLLIAAVFVIMGVLFIKSNGKGCYFISGYNLASPEERKNYDEVKICNYFGKTILIWSIFFIIGALVDYFYYGTGMKLAFLLLIIALVYHIYIRYKKFDEKFKI
ncbi:DUF3784 domain-containing protein [Clostridium beijerinckii]|uniref:DUF3784 domain-containing protein n=1 Tax=Clostridium beijerinckii TaxID=1520 RepID=UPI002331336C|nr:DUF3784 domain-containing protein [Clostridium beijerinckii]